MPIHVRQHLPNFVDIDRQADTDVKRIDDVLAIPWIASWAHDPGFHRYSVSVDHDRHLLMAEYDEGRHWHVIAYLTSSERDFAMTLPEWHPVNLTA